MPNPHYFFETSVNAEDLDKVLDFIKMGETTPQRIANELSRNEQWVWRAVDKLERAGQVKSQIKRRTLFVSAIS